MKKMFKAVGLLDTLDGYGTRYTVYNCQRYSYQRLKVFKRRKHARKFAQR